MNDLAIRVSNLSKSYRIGQLDSHKTLRDTLAKTAIRPFQLARSLVTGTHMGWDSNETFWALKDVSFDVKCGDIVGIIGRNGAGKSTLLKILSRITRPTEGRVEGYGRVGSLLEVGTGFHPELTGRENIYLNGAILGMSKADIRRKFDEIVAFSEVEQFLDTPVKHYSSGMYVRLAFAVAAHLEPDILIVDEVLAVGDINFQKKCLNKMQDVSMKQGRTVLFVSHNMEAIQRLCSQCILLEQSRLTDYDSTPFVVTRYLASHFQGTRPNQWFELTSAVRSGTGTARFVGARYSSLNESIAFQPYSHGALEFLLAIESDTSMDVDSLAVDICNYAGTVLLNADICIYGQIIHLKQGMTIVKLEIEQLYLHQGTYSIGLYVAKTGMGANDTIFDYIESAFEIEVISISSDKFVVEPSGAVACRFSFSEDQ